MCHACIVEGAKREMLSRRKLFTGAAATVIVGAPALKRGTGGPARVLALL